MLNDLLLLSAQEAAKNAYAPYSNFSVGAAVLFDSRDVPYFGCNVENMSYGLTICAERAAIFSGVAAGHRTLKKICITAYDRTGQLLPNFLPCGACLQVINEFGRPDTKIFVNGRGEYLLAELMPLPFRAQ